MIPIAIGVCAFEEAVTPSGPYGLTSVRKDFTCGWGYTGARWEPRFSGVGCQVQRCVATPHLRGMVSPWISQIGVHDITNTWSLEVGVIGGSIGPGQATPLIVCLEIIKSTNNFLRSGALKIFSWESTLQCQSGERKNKHFNWKTPTSPMYHRHVCVSCLSDPADAEIYSSVHMSLGHCLWTQASYNTNNKLLSSPSVFISILISMTQSLQINIEY